MNIVQALKKTKNELLAFITTNLNNKSDIRHTHTASDCGAVSRTLIWENANSTEFSGQSLELTCNLSDYDGVEILYWDYSVSEPPPLYSTGFLIHGGSPSGMLDVGTMTEMICVSGHRHALIELATMSEPYGELITFGDAYNSSNVVDNTISVPYQIYGIKGVIL